MSKKTYEQIKESERHAIALGLQQKQSIRAIARALGRSPSTFSREIHRNAGGNGYASRFAINAAASGAFTAAPSPSCIAREPCFDSCATIYTSTGHLSKLPGT